MKLFNREKNILELQIENLDDLWYLSHIISKGDLVSGKTYRKIKIGDKVTKKPFFLKISVERVEFHTYADMLRVSGKVTEGNEDVTTGSYHTFSLKENTTFTLEKQKMLSFQEDKLQEALRSKQSRILLVAMDREEAYLALLKKYGYEEISHVTGDVTKKGYETSGGNFYQELLNIIIDLNTRQKFEHIIVASPAFFKEDFLKIVPDELKGKISLATISTVSKASFYELLKRDELKTVLNKDKSAKESSLLDELKKEISKDGNCAYGISEVKKAAEMGAISKLFVSDNLISEYRINDSFDEIDTIINNVDTSQGDINIFSSESTRELDGLGGIAAILRYKIS